MTTYLINHLRIPGEIPNAEGLEYLEKVEATFRPYGGQWLGLGQHHEGLEGAWPGSGVLMGVPDRNAAQEGYRSPPYPEILHLRTPKTITHNIPVPAVRPNLPSAEV